MHDAKAKETHAVDPFAWLTERLDPKPSGSTPFLYDHMGSQSGRCLAVIYQPFDPSKRTHFVDRGQMLDFAAHAGGGRILDFGPGDGWPSLLIAPRVEEVVGLEGCERRAAVCNENAERLGIENATFIAVEPGRPMPFDDGSFDAVVASSSLEQTPDPRTALAELRLLARLTGFEIVEVYGDVDGRPFTGAPGDDYTVVAERR
jgi:SAM-dependent methyltransferase